MKECSQDGVHAMVPRDRMSPAARKIRDTYAITPGAPFLQNEFGFFCLDRWIGEGHLPKDDPWGRMWEVFQFQKGNAKFGLGGAGWCEADFAPTFEEKVLEDRGDYELVHDHAGRAVLCFKGRRSGFMPEYVDHPVKDMKSWIENCKWRLDPKTPSRWTKIEEIRQGALSGAAEGQIVTQHVAGGYMYLRSLVGPTDLLYKFYDEPDLIHDCMRTWFEVADAAAARHQEFVTIDELFLGEDICYNHGSLISPDMIREFLFPYYQQLYTDIKRRNIDKRRHVFFNIDTDGGHTNGYHCCVSFSRPLGESVGSRETRLPLHERFYSAISTTTPASANRFIHPCGDVMRHLPVRKQFQADCDGGMSAYGGVAAGAERVRRRGTWARAVVVRMLIRHGLTPIVPRQPTDAAAPAARAPHRHTGVVNRPAPAAS